MSTRIRRRGVLVASATGSSLLPEAGPCGSCENGLCGARATVRMPSSAARTSRASAAVSAAVASGTMNQSVAISISHGGLSTACLLLFGPVIASLAAVAQLSAVGYGSALFHLGSAVALMAALLLGGVLARKFSARLIDLKLEAG